MWSRVRQSISSCLSVFSCQSSYILLCIAVHICNAQDSDIPVVEKAINGTTSVDCGCDDISSCLVIINDVILDMSEYKLLDNNSLLLSANDRKFYGNITCGSPEQLKEYKICPPLHGQYDNWVHIMPSATIVAVEDTLEIIGSFSHLPHSAISIYIDGSISHDDDMSCTVNNNVYDKIVSYNCTAKRASIKHVWLQVPFCGIDFRSETLNIIIMEEPATSMTETTTPSSNVTLTVNVTATESEPNKTASSMITPTNLSVAVETDESGVSTAAIIVPVVVFLVLAAAVVIAAVIYIKCFRSTDASPTVNDVTMHGLPTTVENGSMPNGNHNNTNHLAINNAMHADNDANDGSNGDDNDANDEAHNDNNGNLSDNNGDHSDNEGNINDPNDNEDLNDNNGNNGHNDADSVHNNDDNDNENHGDRDDNPPEEGGVQIADPEEDTGTNIQENPEVPTTSVNAECTSSGYTQQHAEMVLLTKI